MQWINDLKELLFPRYCKVCRRRLMQSEQHLCINCLLDLPRTHYEREPNNLLMQHLMEWPEVIRATAYFYYYKEGKYSSLIHHLKYYDHPEVGTYLGRLAATELKASGFFDGIDLIIPVPLSKKKQRQRGYNQCDYIARGISEITGIIICTDCIERSINTDTQTAKGRIERWKNTEGIFRITNAETLKGKHILLLDDVATTGATLHACISTLLTVPGVRVSVFALAKAT
ncbi:MAG: ComF family protein [Bacteroidaceae bacterium]|nr:ComF family protein [Bacteroidaceae bacterium]